MMPLQMNLLYTIATPSHFWTRSTTAAILGAYVWMCGGVNRWGTPCLYATVLSFPPVTNASLKPELPDFPDGNTTFCDCMRVVSVEK
jgi:hypothetical protein